MQLLLGVVPGQIYEQNTAEKLTMKCINGLIVRRKTFAARICTRPTHNVRQGFGSFHSDDIEQLIINDHINLSTYDRVRTISDAYALQALQEARSSGDHKCLYNIDFNNWTFLNHGAFGAVLSPLLHESMLWRYEIEKQPLKFFDRDLFPLEAYALQQMAKFINCPPNELLPLQNVTSGLNSVFNSVSLAKGDAVVCLSLTYGATKKMLNDLCLRSGATLQTIHFALPVTSRTELIDSVCAQINETTAKLIVLDCITSNTAMVLPVIEIAARCRQMASKPLVVMDAAHSLMAQPVSIYPAAADQSTGSVSGTDSSSVGKSTPDAMAGGGGGGGGGDDQSAVCSDGSGLQSTTGQAPLTISDVADVWLTNGHKWFCGPKGCAFMWVSPAMQQRQGMAGGLRPAVISHGFSSATERDAGTTDDRRAVLSAPGKTLSGFAWDGCRDYTALLCVPSAIRLWNTDIAGRGDTRTGKTLLTHSREYMRKLLHEATELLVSEWSLSPADFAAPFDMRQDSPMSLVPLPDVVAGIRTRGPHVSDNDAFCLQERLHHEFAVEVPVKCLEGRLYVRISAHIYNDIGHYKILARAVKNMV